MDIEQYFQERVTLHILTMSSSACAQMHQLLKVILGESQFQIQRIYLTLTNYC